MCTQTCPEVKTSALDTAEKWEEVCRQTCIQAAFIRVAALWAEEVNGQFLEADLTLIRLLAGGCKNDAA